MSIRIALVLSIVASFAVAQPDATVRVERPSVASGPADAAQWTRIVRARQASFRYCYEQRLLAEPALGGSVVMTLSVDTDGTVSNAELRGTLASHEALSACLARMARSLRGPSAAGASRIVLRMAFAPAAPPTSQVPPAPAPDQTVPTVRAELSSARTEMRCLSRAATRLEGVLARWEAGNARQRERLEAELAQARSAISSCHNTLASVLQTQQVQGLLLGQQCPPGCVPNYGNINLRKSISARPPSPDTSPSRT